jgi:hypothetical protein
MQRGALLMMDALGFRDVWQTHDAEQVLAKMQGLKDRMEQRYREQALAHQEACAKPPDPSGSLAGLGARLVGPPPELAFLSDTVVAAAFEGRHGTLLSALSAVTFAASTIVDEALRHAPTFLYRGCITVGEFAVRQPFIIGKAVTRAALLHEEAQGAFIWWDALANEVVGPLREDELAITTSVWDVPMKDGARFRTRVVMPFDRFESLEDRRSTIDAATEVFDRSLGDVRVQIKRQRTLEFLESLYEAMGEPWQLPGSEDG